MKSESLLYQIDEAKNRWESANTDINNILWEMTTELQELCSQKKGVAVSELQAAKGIIMEMISRNRNYPESIEGICDAFRKIYDLVKEDDENSLSDV